jgi:hypothetical protein
MVFTYEYLGFYQAIAIGAYLCGQPVANIRGQQAAQIHVRATLVK